MRLTMRPVVQPNTPHDRHILGRQRAQQLLDLIFFSRRFGGDGVVAAEDFDFEAALLGESVDVGVLVGGGDDGLAVLDAAVLGGDVAD